MINNRRLHHIAIICSDYQKSKWFYTEIFGFKIEKEICRKERQSYILDLSLNGSYLIELFSFPNPPNRPSTPEATGMRHIVFEVENVNNCIQILANNNIETEPIRIEEFTNKKSLF